MKDSHLLCNIPAIAPNRYAPRTSAKCVVTPAAQQFSKSLWNFALKRLRCDWLITEANKNGLHLAMEAVCRDYTWGVE
jgi:hypothetical protein